jgi:hypothetical protein
MACHVVGFESFQLLPRYRSHIILTVNGGYCNYLRSQGSSVGIVSDYGLDDRAIGVRSPAEEGGFFV